MNITRYAIFHPLAYLVKLNIEMSMAHLIKKIAMDHSHNSDTFVISNSYNRALQCCTHESDSLPPSRKTISILKSVFSSEESHSTIPNNEILKTEEFRVQSGHVTDLEIQQSAQRDEQEIYDGSSFVSNHENLAWTDLECRNNTEGDQDTSSVSRLRRASTANDDTHVTRPLPAILPPLK